MPQYIKCTNHVKLMFKVTISYIQHYKFTYSNLAEENVSPSMKISLTHILAKGNFLDIPDNKYPVPQTISSSD